MRRRVAISLPRRAIIDLLSVCAKIPTVPVERRMSIGPLVAARASCGEPPSWVALFVRAYALVSEEIPELRRAYFPYPWPRLCEYDVPRAGVAIERDYEGEPGVFALLIVNPHWAPLSELVRQIEGAATLPVEAVSSFRRVLRISRLPWPVRRVLWWLAYHVPATRIRHFGTFNCSVYSALGAQSLHPLSAAATIFNYGVIGSDGDVAVRIIYDHRVMDGATVARVLARLEQKLNGQIVEEVEAFRLGQAAKVHPRHS